MSEESTLGIWNSLWSNQQLCIKQSGLKVALIYAGDQMNGQTFQHCGDHKGILKLYLSGHVPNVVQVDQSTKWTRTLSPQCFNLYEILYDSLALLNSKF